jgi:hypothetical protein
MLFTFDAVKRNFPLSFICSASSKLEVHTFTLLSLLKSNYMTSRFSAHNDLRLKIVQTHGTFSLGRCNYEIVQI